MPRTGPRCRAQEWSSPHGTERRPSPSHGSPDRWSSGRSGSLAQTKCAKSWYSLDELKLAHQRTGDATAATTRREAEEDPGKVIGVAWSVLQEDSGEVAELGPGI